MEESKLFSIIVPVFNMEKYVIDCLDSLSSQQTDFTYEVIVIDDGSVDSSYSLCKSYCDRYDNFHLYKKANGGLGSARNYGLVFSTGRFILFLDSDDRLRQDALTILGLEITNHSDVDIIRFGLTRLSKDGDFKYSTSLETPTFGSILACRSANSACLQTYNIKLFDDVKFAEGRYYEDVSTVFKLYHKSKCIRVCKEYLYQYYEREGSITHALSEQKVDDILFACEEAKDFLQSNNISDEYSSALDERIITLAISILKRLHDDNTNSPLHAKTIAAISNMICIQDVLSFLLRSNHELLHDFIYYIYHGYQNYASRLSLDFTKTEQAVIKNYKLSCTMNKLAVFLEQNFTADEKVVLYGYGVIGKYCHSLLKERVSAIVDKAYMSFQNITNGVLVNCPKSLNNSSYDKVLITVFGREILIKNYLMNECGVDSESIIIFDEGV